MTLPTFEREISCLFSPRLEEVATHYACSEVEGAVVLSSLDLIAHYLFYYVLYIFYPEYEQFYWDTKVEACRYYDLPCPVYQSSSWSDAILFMHRFIATPSTIGSIFPSSRRLVESITRKIPQDEIPHRYLEIGAGTGSFTEAIIAKMQPTDRLDVVEYDPELCQLLRRKYRHLPNVTIYQMSILDFEASQKYDVVISGLPLNAFESGFVEQVLQKYVELTAPQGHLSYFEYIGLEKIKRAFLFGEGGADFDQVLGLKADFVRDYGSETDEVFLNMTPARVRHCRMPITPEDEL